MNDAPDIQVLDIPPEKMLEAIGAALVRACGVTLRGGWTNPVGMLPYWHAAPAQEHDADQVAAAVANAIVRDYTIWVDGQSATSQEEQEAARNRIRHGVVAPYFTALAGL